MRGLTVKPIARVSSRLGSSLTAKRIRATGKRPNGGASASSMPPCTNCASSWNAPSPGRINSSVCCCALRPNTFVILGSNLLPSRSSISGSFVEAETCNQFIDSNGVVPVGQLDVNTGSTNGDNGSMRIEPRQGRCLQRREGVHPGHLLRLNLGDQRPRCLNLLDG